MEYIIYGTHCVHVSSVNTFKNRIAKYLVSAGSLRTVAGYA